jgi:hypothetical protein
MTCSTMAAAEAGTGRQHWTAGRPSMPCERTATVDDLIVSGCASVQQAHPRQQRVTGCKNLHRMGQGAAWMIR